jgi:hypothetical protein
VSDNFTYLRVHTSRFPYCIVQYNKNVKEIGATSSAHFCDEGCTDSEGEVSALLRVTLCLFNLVEFCENYYYSFFM